jgi:enoyl-[acyl-carrier protein] reductase/trans-2-enoyl-CoA reductase (NAD+)
MRSDIQSEVGKLWQNVTTETVPSTTDFEGFQEDFLKLFGFRVAGVDYDADVNQDVPIESLKNHSLIG